MKLLALVLLAPVVLAALGDITAAAIVTGFFSSANVVLTSLVHHRTRKISAGQTELRRELRAPRRAVYDSDGRIIGTVIELHTSLHDQRLEKLHTQHGDGATLDDQDLGEGGLR